MSCTRSVPSRSLRDRHSAAHASWKTSKPSRTTTRATLMRVHLYAGVAGVAKRDFYADDLKPNLFAFTSARKLTEQRRPMVLLVMF